MEIERFIIVCGSYIMASKYIEMVGMMMHFHGCDPIESTY